jgi:hypothetical protein
MTGKRLRDRPITLKAPLKSEAMDDPRTGDQLPRSRAGSLDADHCIEHRRCRMRDLTGTGRPSPQIQHKIKLLLLIFFLAPPADESPKPWSSAMSTILDSFVLKVLLATHRPSDGINPDCLGWRTLTRWPFARYRPELHYMRGPGPKWREKHGNPTAVRRG